MSEDAMDIDIEDDVANDVVTVLAEGPEMCEDTEKGECEEIEFVADVVLFTFFMLLLGLVTKNLLRKVPIPYTGLLLIGPCVRIHSWRTAPRYSSRVQIAA